MQTECSNKYCVLCICNMRGTHLISQYEEERRKINFRAGREILCFLERCKFKIITRFHKKAPTIE